MSERNRLHCVLWAKTDRTNQSASYHPLVCHLIDVTAVASTLWDRVLPSALRQRITDGLGMKDPADAGGWVSYLAGLHDIGKASPGFQRKDRLRWARVMSAGFSCPIEPVDVGHGTVSASALRDLLVQPDLGGLPLRAVVRYIASAIGGHHGIFPSASEVRAADTENVRGAADWGAARADLAKALAELCAISSRPTPGEIDVATSTIIAGIVSVADWIGSDDRYFSYASVDGSEPEIDLDAYTDQSRARAADAFAALGWLDWSPDPAQLDFEDLFPFITTPRPVQSAVGQLSGIPDTSGIVIIEVPMGEGKTEAAFYLADRWTSVLNQNGLYVAMPTMATSNQMFGRLREFLAYR